MDKVLAKRNDKDNIHKIDNELDCIIKDSGLQYVWMGVHSDYKYLIPANNLLTLEDENEYRTHDSAKNMKKTV